MEKHQLEKTGSKFIKPGMLEEEVEHIRYWEQVYATTNSEALKQRAAIILGIKMEKK